MRMELFVGCGLAVWVTYSTIRNRPISEIIAIANVPRVILRVRLWRDVRDGLRSARAVARSGVLFVGVLAELVAALLGGTADMLCVRRTVRRVTDGSV